MEREIKVTKIIKVRILFFIVLGLILIVLIIFKSQNIALKHNDKYTIGVLNKLFISKAGDMKFLFKVKGKTYLSTGYTQDKSKKVEGGRYFVVFNDRNPSICEMFTNLPVPDSIQKAPYEGWNKLPIPEYQKNIDNYFEKATNSWFMRMIPPW